MTANVKVQIAFADGAMAASPTWTDVSAYVDLSQGISLNRGRGRTATQAEPGRCSLTLNNDDGRFTWGDPAGAYGLGMGDQPQLRQPLRVSADFGGGYAAIWTGYVDEWVGGWDGGVRPVVRVTASDRVSRLQLVNLNDPAIMAEVKYDQPVLYVPFDEAAGATSFGDQSGNVGQDPLLPNGTKGTPGIATIDAGASVGPDGAGTAVALTPVDVSNGRYITRVQPTGVSSGDWTVGLWFRTTVATGGLLYIRSNVGASLNWYINSSTDITANDGPITVPPVDDGAWHYLAVAYDSATMTIFVYFDGVLEYTKSVIVGIGGISGGAGLETIIVGFSPDTQLLFEGVVAHLAIFASELPAARILAHYEAGQASGSFYGDTADERFTRLCRLAGLPSALYASDATATTVLGAQPLDGVGLMDAILQVTDSERGVAYVDGAGVLTYLSSASVSGLTSALTLGPSDVDQDVTLTTNDQELVNDVTVTRPGGATQRRADQASIDSIGQAATTVDTLLTTDAAAGALADLLLSQGLVVHPRTDDLTLDLRAKATTIDADAAVALDTGSRVTVAGLPDGAPASTLELMVTGVAHRITHVEWDLTLTVAPLQTLPPWELGDAVLGVLGKTTRLAYAKPDDTWEAVMADAVFWVDAGTGPS